MAVDEPGYSHRGEHKMKKVLFFIIVMTFLYHAVIFELVLGKFSPFPSALMWVFVAIISWFVGNSIESFSRTLFVVVTSFIVSGIISYFLMSYYIRESVEGLVQIITLRMISISLLTVFTLSSICAFFGYMFRSR